MLEGLTGIFADGMDWEWRHGHHNDKSNSKGKCGGPSTTLRSGRDDAVFEVGWGWKNRGGAEALKGLLAGSIPCS
jgi:hypothetical protein